MSPPQYISPGRFPPPVNGRAKPDGVCRNEFESTLIRVIALLRREITDELVAPLAARIAALEARPASGPGIEYRGIWQAGEKYSAGAMTTFQGGLWLCRAASTFTRPGSND